MITKCPIGLDNTPQLCSAGTCTVCREIKKSGVIPHYDYEIRSDRKVNPETLTDHQKKELLKKKAESIEKRVLKERNYTSPEIKPSKSYYRKMKLKKIGNYILKTIASENTLGQYLHGILDNSPFPNQMVAKYVSSKIHPEKREEERAKMWTKRNIIALVFSAMIIFLIVTGRVDDAIALSKALMSFV